MNKNNYGAIITLDLHSLSDTQEGAEEKVNTFLDWLDKSSSAMGVVAYDSTDYVITDTRDEWLADHTDTYDNNIH